MKIPCYMEFDERTRTVTMRHAKTDTIQMMIKLEEGSIATMQRIVPDHDCDNFWIGVKPADSVVFEEILFGPKKLIVSELKFNMK